MNNVTIIIQGRIYIEELKYKMIDTYFKLGNIIVSSYFKNYPQVIHKLSTFYYLVALTATNIPTLCPASCLFPK